MPRLPPELASGRDHKARDSDSIAWIGQINNIEAIGDLGTGEWTTLYEFESDGDGSQCFYSALMPIDLVSKALKDNSWEVRIGDGLPSFTRYYHDGNEETKYERFGSHPVEPIVFSRSFHGIKPAQFDISEELRHFHNLYHDRANDRYLHINDRGNESLAIESTLNRVRIKTRLLRQYMAARQWALAIYFDHRANASVNTAAAKAAHPNATIAKKDRRYDFYIDEIAGRTFSRLIGKKIILPPPISESGVWPFTEARRFKHAEFIVGIDDTGTPVLHNCDPNSLANYFGANEGAPHYLTPVWFTRNVLSKYYDDPNKYSVEDGYLRCGSLWGMQIDNNLPDHVVAYLGDLGRDLDYEEQTYWKHFNVTPSERKSSETNYRRSFLAQFSDPSAPDLVFKQHYTRLNEAWLKRIGWFLFRSSHESDLHIMKQLRVPISETLSEFETQVLYLVKLTIDSLNEKELATELGGALEREQGISKFERYLEAKKYAFKDRDIRLLRTLQSLRSAGVAHAKGSNFDKLKVSVGLDRDSPRIVFRRLLERVNLMLVELSIHFTA